MRGSVASGPCFEQPPLGGIESLIGAIGRDDFGKSLALILRRECSAEHCAILVYRNEVPERVVSASADGTDSAYNSISIYLDQCFFLQDRAMDEVRQRAQIMNKRAFSKLRIETLPAGNFRDVMYRRTDICERVLLYQASASHGMAMSVLRSNRAGPFSRQSLARLQEMSGALFAAAEKHADLSLAKQQRPWSMLSSLPDIEARLTTAAVSMPRREREVCARILYGIFTAGIALDLGIGEESVRTYRKRAFQRINIASRHELLVWYLALKQDSLN